MPTYTEEQYEEFTNKVDALALEVLGIRLVKWVMPINALDEEMRVMEDTFVPGEQLLIDTAGLLRFATVNCDWHLVQAHSDDDD